MTAISEPKRNVLCLPAKAIRDELGVDILAQLLFNESCDVQHTTRLGVGEALELVGKRNPDAVCIGVVAPFVLSHASFLCTKIRQKMPQLPIVIGLWGFAEVPSEIIDKLNSAGASKVALSLSKAVEILKEIRSSK